MTLSSQKQMADMLKVDQATISRLLGAMGKIQKYGKWISHEFPSCFHMIFPRYNAPSHKAKTVQDTLEALNWESLTHAAYSQDLAPSDYHLFSSMGHTLKEQHFKT